jgi:hypothetical protein
LLFAIPFQTRKILWHQNWNFNEWQSASVYGTDLILLVLLIFWVWNYFKAGKILNPKPETLNKFQNLKSKIQNPDFYLLILIVVSAISIKNSSSYVLSAYSVLKLIEFIALYFYIKSYAIYRFGLIGSMVALVCGGLFQGVIAILQFFKQSDLGLRLLGESVLAPNLNGVASFYNLAGEKIMRAYGTTPHPNILASYLFLAIFSFYFLFLYINFKHKNTGTKVMTYFNFGRYVYAHGWAVVYVVLLLSLFFTFARVAIFLWVFGFIIRACLILGKQRFRKIFGSDIYRTKLTRILIVTVATVTLFGGFYWSETVSRIKISSGEEAVQLRVFYNKESVKSVNWFGAGSGNFVNWLMFKDPNLPRNLYQPVHNIYLLIYSEVGILGVSAFILFLIFLIKDFIVSTKMDKLYHYSVLIFFLSFLFMGLFDHFLWTLQQGRLMLWILCAGLVFFSNSSHNLHA